MRDARYKVEYSETGTRQWKRIGGQWVLTAHIAANCTNKATFYYDRNWRLIHQG